MRSRIDGRGRVLHYGIAGTYVVGSVDQCEYEGCVRVRVSRSRHCVNHSR